MLGAAKGEVTLTIEQDGAPVPESMRGSDIAVRKGKTVVDVTEHRLYRLIASDVYHRATLTLRFADAGAEIYRFSFGACKE